MKRLFSLLFLFVFCGYAYALSVFDVIESDLLQYPQTVSFACWSYFGVDDRALNALVAMSPVSGALLYREGEHKGAYLPLRFADAPCFYSGSVAKSDLYAFWVTPGGAIVDLFGHHYASFGDIKPVVRGWEPRGLRISGDYVVKVPYDMDGVYLFFIGVRPHGSSGFSFDGWWSAEVVSVQVFKDTTPLFDAFARRVNSMEDVKRLVESVGAVGLSDMAENSYRAYLYNVLPWVVFDTGVGNCYGHATFAYELLKKGLGLQDIWFVAEMAEDPRCNHAALIFKYAGGFGYVSTVGEDWVRWGYDTAYDALVASLPSCSSYKAFVLYRDWRDSLERVLIWSSASCGEHFFEFQSFSKGGHLFYGQRGAVVFTLDDLRRCGWSAVVEALDRGRPYVMCE